MIKTKVIFVACLATLIIFGCTTSKKATSENEPYFTITVEQDGTIVSPVNNVVTLKKKPFKFNILIKEETRGVYLTATWDDYMFNFPEDKNIFFCRNAKKGEDCGFVYGGIMATDLYNSDKSIIVGDSDAQQYWYYDKEDSRHRLDKGVVIENGWIKATFTVEKTWDRLVENRDEREADISEINRDIYMLFAASDYNKKKDFDKEVQREKFVITFK